MARAFSLLRATASQPRVGRRLVELAEECGLERPTAHRILQGLVAEGVVVQDRETRRYRLGPLLQELGLAAKPQTPVLEAWRPLLEGVARDTGQTAFLTVRSGFDGVCLDRQEGAFPVKVLVLEPGRRRPLGIGAGGMALFAFEGAPERERILAANADRLALDWPGYSPEEIARRARTTRRLGHALHEVQEMRGIRSVAVPILAPSHRPLGAFSVSALSSVLKGERLAATIDILRRAAEKAALIAVES
nr:IclR family transcriptional regulator [Roseococcus sp. MDT2-1-1]